MHRVMFVDDEEHVCNVMENLIAWDEFGIEVLPSAKSAQEAIENINRYHPAIVFTDIEMPQMNGIELIRAMRKQTRFVVMSGYNDFAYVRTSMKLGALNYLLKPVSQDELIETLIECLDVLDREPAGQQSSQETIKALRDYTLGRLIRGQISLTELREKSKVVGLNLRYPKTVCVLFTALNQNVPQELLLQMQEVVQTLILDHIPGYSFFDNTGNLVLILTFATYTPDKAKVYELIQQCVSAMRETCQIPKALASVGMFVSTSTELSNSYASAQNMLQYHLLRPDLQVLHTDLKLNEMPIDYFRPANPMMISSLLREKNAEKLKSYIDDTMCIGVQPNTTAYQHRIIETATHLLVAAEQLDFQESGLRNIRNEFFRTLEDKKVYQKELLYELVDTLLREHQIVNTQYSAKIRLAIQKIHDRYSDHNFSLKCLADELNVNSAYLGRQFKAETDVFFSDYLNKYRVQKAQELLLVTDLPASEIGARVGYTTTNYFYGIFKKFVGVNTTAYRTAAKEK